MQLYKGLTGAYDPPIEHETPLQDNPNLSFAVTYSFMKVYGYVYASIYVHVRHSKEQ